MPYTVVKVAASRLNPNAKWLVYKPGEFNTLLYEHEIPVDIRAEVKANNNSQFFEVDLAAKPFKWGSVAAVPEDWPKPVPSYFAKQGQEVVEVEKIDPPASGVLVGTKMP